MSSGGTPLNATRHVRVLTALSITALLSGCGLLSNVIGEREIPNPFGVNNREVSITLASEGSAAGLAVQAEGTKGTSFTFSDQNFNLLGFEGDYIKSEVGFAPGVTLSRPAAGTYPSSFTVTKMSVTLMLSDDGVNGDARTVTTTSTLDGALTFGKRATCTNLDLSCGYTYDEASSGTLTNALLLELGTTAATDSDLARAIRIIQLDGDDTPNTVTLTFALTTDSTPDLAGSTLEVTLKEGKSVVKL